MLVYEETAASGTEMAGKLAYAASANGKLKIIEGDASVDLNLGAAFQANNQYVLSAWIAEDTKVALTEYTGNPGMGLSPERYSSAC